jgi:geranylgeranyl pyrophosphate synthase
LQVSSQWLVCPRVTGLLEGLEDELRRAVDTADGAAAEVAVHLIARGGKRLRPALLLLAGQFGSANPALLTRAAVAMELLHVASLYHDDVMDRATTRRGAASANSLWGNLLAASGGTLLFARAVGLLASLGDEANRLAGAASVRLCTGQLQEVENAYDVDISEEDHLAILERKTATLFELPCGLGALLAGAPEDTRRVLAQYARALGLAFQLADDALDLSGDESILGKPTLTDIREGVYSFPIIYALHQNGGELRDTLRKARLNETEVRAVIAAVRRSGAVEVALGRAGEFVREAQQSLTALEDTPARESLHRLADFAVMRSH